MSKEVAVFESGGALVPAACSKLLMTLLSCGWDILYDILDGCWDILDDMIDGGSDIRDECLDILDIMTLSCFYFCIVEEKY